MPLRTLTLYPKIRRRMIRGNQLLWYAGRSASASTPSIGGYAVQTAVMRFQSHCSLFHSTPIGTQLLKPMIRKHATSQDAAKAYQQPLWIIQRPQNPIQPRVRVSPALNLQFSPQWRFRRNSTGKIFLQPVKKPLPLHGESLQGHR